MPALRCFHIPAGFNRSLRGAGLFGGYHCHAGNPTGNGFVELLIHCEGSARREGAEGGNHKVTEGGNWNITKGGSHNVTEGNNHKDTEADENEESRREANGSEPARALLKRALESYRRK